MKESDNNFSVTDSKTIPFKLNENLSIVFPNRRKSQVVSEDSVNASKETFRADSKAKSSNK